MLNHMKERLKNMPKGAIERLSEVGTGTGQ